MSWSRAGRSDGVVIGLAAGSLLVAGAIYVLFRSGARLHGWAEALDTFGAVAALRGACAGLALPGPIRYSLPDALWQGAFSLLMFYTWRGVALSPAKLAFCSAPVVIGLGCELGQAAGWVEGVFDPWDLGLSMVAIATAYAIAAAASAHERRGVDHRRRQGAT